MTDYKKNVLCIPEICTRHGIKYAVLSPGSRSAPLSLAFLRHPEIKCKTIVDERSAGFVALGMAQQLQLPVVLICTSGTALLNYAPAVAEALYQKIPLIIFSADRPAEWIGQNDGQTIHQKNVFAGNSLGFFELPVEDRHPDVEWQVERLVSDCINLSQKPTPGPVHVNVPLRDPLYPDSEFKYPKNPNMINLASSQAILTVQSWDELLAEWNSTKKKLLVAGLNHTNNTLKSTIANLQKKQNLPVLNDVTANLETGTAIRYPDIFLWSNSEELKQELAPDLLITLGGPVVSKSLKLFIRKCQPKVHWQIQKETISVDQFKSLTRILPVSVDYFFLELEKRLNAEKKVESVNYLKAWQDADARAGKILPAFFEATGFSELKAMSLILSVLPKKCNLHLGNSSIVRHANFIADIPVGTHVNSNRGTNGIDGSVSTAVGAAGVQTIQTVLIVGDLAFFYDRNGLWQHDLPSNLKIIVFNNQGGGIFRNLDGPAQLPELEANFEVGHHLTAERTAVDHGLEYFSVSNEEDLQEKLPQFFRIVKPALLEIHFDKYKNSGYYTKFKGMMREFR